MAAGRLSRDDDRPDEAHTPHVCPPKPRSPLRWGSVGRHRLTVGDVEGIGDAATLVQVGVPIGHPHAPVARVLLH